MATEQQKAAALVEYQAAVRADPGRHAFAPRLAEGRGPLSVGLDSLGSVVTLRPDEHGIVRPASLAEVHAADVLGLEAITDAPKEKLSHGQPD